MRVGRWRTARPEPGVGRLFPPCFLLPVAGMKRVRTQEGCCGACTLAGSLPSLPCSGRPPLPQPPSARRLICLGSAHSDGPALTTKVKILSGPRAPGCSRATAGCALQTDSLGGSDSKPEPGCSHRDLPEIGRSS